MLFVLFLHYLDLPLTYKILVDVVGMLFCGRPSQNWSFGTTESKIDRFPKKWSRDVVGMGWGRTRHADVHHTS